MKYNLKEHPHIFMVLVALVLVGCSITIAALYDWSIFAIIAIVISGLVFLVLTYTFLKDLFLFLKQKKEYENTLEDTEKEHE